MGDVGEGRERMNGPTETVGTVAEVAIIIW